MDIHLKPIGYIRSPRTEVRDDGWGEVESTFELAEHLSPESLDGLDQFSHVELVYFFHAVPEGKIEWKARPPRNNPAWAPVGIFAQRAKGRPNRLGVSIAKLLRREGRVLTLQGLDAIDGTPVLDLKPVLFEFLPQGELHQPAWSHELMRQYW